MQQGPPVIQVQCFIDEFSPTEPYYSHDQGEASMLCRQRNRHMGQVKLLLSEIDFLTDFARQGDIIVYVGAADGMHMPTLASMFKGLNLQWHLFDPARFSQQVMDWQKQNKESVHVYNREFTDQDTAMFASSQNVLFISDIRTSNRAENNNTEPGDDAVMQNQMMQMQWVLDMQPRACCLKFRGAYDYTEETRSFQYLKGQLRLQVMMVMTMM